MQNGEIYYSAYHERQVFVEVLPYVLPADNYMASWYCNHMGSRATKFCRFAALAMLLKLPEVAKVPQEITFKYTAKCMV
jgi:hypothetical protein